jgi:hypothetical protein
MKKQNMCSVTLFNRVDIMLGIVFDSNQLDACLIGFKLREGAYLGIFGLAIEINWKLVKDSKS